MNRLSDELSPYLQQHAHNPVDWYPWTSEAFERAKQEDKPILLSIGYSACHWCHVMERESFDDANVARLMNERFINIKVDREERPDLDQTYQTVVQLMGRGGGWPLTVFLTPDRKPFFAGTYFPPEDRHGLPSFSAVLRATSDAFGLRRQEVETSAGRLTDAIAQVGSARNDPSDVPSDFLAGVSQKLARTFDDTHGGFGDAPKFPNTMALDLWLRAYREHGDKEALDRVCKTLDAMRDGGIWDHLGGGFHRYSTDARWCVPHFEKMLYDNALLARLYVDAWRITGQDRYQHTARRTLDYVLREMTSEEGGFYSAQDADSEGHEGVFFVWTPEQFDALLGQDAEVLRLHFGVAPGGNFEGGTTVLHVNRTTATVAAQTGLNEAEVIKIIERGCRTLWEARERRPKPLRDDKVIASWNALMISAFAEAGAAFGEPRYLKAATDALSFIQRRLWIDGSLMRLYRNGVGRTRAFLEDYANAACAALDVYETTFDMSARDFAFALTQTAIARFADSKGGGFFCSEEREDVLLRIKERHDNATPSGSSSLCHALLRLHAHIDDPELLDHARRTLRSAAREALEIPLAFGHLLAAFDRLAHGSTEVVVVGDRRETTPLLDVAWQSYVPNRALTLVSPGTKVPSGLGSLVDAAAGGPCAYVCQDRTCGPPLRTPEALRSALTRNPDRV